MIECPDCGCTHMELAADNGAQYPQPRRERYACVDCGRETTVVLTA